MKKTLTALAILSAFAGSAFAANVTLYGRIDTGLAYTNIDQDRGAAGEFDKFEMTTGYSTGSRWGLKGTEELGNGLKVGFILENGFSSDDGTLGQGGRLFGREATVSLSGGFGKVVAGRMNTLASDGGSMALAGNMSAMGNCYGVLSMKGSTGSAYDRYDNLIGYVSPNFAGLELSAQYSMGQKGEDENKATANRYGVVGAKYAAGPIAAVATVEYTVYGHAAGEDVDNGVAVQLGGNYNFGAAQLFVKGSYFDNQKAILDSFNSFITAGQYEGWGLEVGVKAPAAGGTVFGAVSYRDAENIKNTDDEYKRMSAGVGYSYAFSKRTNVYGSLGYAQEKSEAKDQTAQAYQVGVGLVHKF